jgi:hypothetical protein
VDLDVALWRYFSLSKFVSLLQTKSIVFAPAVMLDDRFEGTFPSSDTAVRRVRRALASGPRRPTAEQEAILAEDMTRITRNLRLGVVVSCWHASEQESVAMWKVYAADAVCIRSTYRKLCGVLNAPTDPRDDWPTNEYRVGQVKYIDYTKDSIDNMHGLAAFMHKRIEFAHEREVRAVSVDSKPPLQPAPRAVPVDLGALVTGVLVAPGTRDWFVDVVESLLTDYGLNVPVTRSALDQEPTL